MEVFDSTYSGLASYSITGWWSQPQLQTAMVGWDGIPHPQSLQAEWELWNHTHWQCTSNSPKPSTTRPLPFRTLTGIIWGFCNRSLEAAEQRVTSTTPHPQLTHLNVFPWLTMTVPSSQAEAKRGREEWKHTARTACLCCLNSIHFHQSWSTSVAAIPQYFVWFWR